MSQKFQGIGFVVTAILIVAGIGVLARYSDSIVGVLYFVPFALGPLFVSLLIAMASPPRICQILLVVGSLLYAGWFGFIILDAFHWNLDPQSPIALLFVGIYSLPVMVPIWTATLIFRRRCALSKQAVSGE